MPDRKQVIDAIRASWSKDTSAVPDEWTPDDPARGQCDASSFVFWETFGGNLVLAEVYVDGERKEHHYWNRIDGEDIDLTADQFRNGEEIREKSLVPFDFIVANEPTMRDELRQRIGLLRESVEAKVAEVSHR